jgi:hypothetical protein
MKVSSAAGAISGSIIFPIEGAISVIERILVGGVVRSFNMEGVALPVTLSIS